MYNKNYARKGRDQFGSNTWNPSSYGPRTMDTCAKIGDPDNKNAHKGFCGTMGYVNESELNFVPAVWMYKYNRSKYSSQIYEQTGGLLGNSIIIIFSCKF